MSTVILVSETQPVIVVIAYERTLSLERLLKSLNAAYYPEANITLLISIGRKSDNSNVVAIANHFEWLYGDKIVEYTDQELNLTAHYHYALNYISKYDQIIILEDDLVVSPSFFFFASQAIDAYKSEENVAGISLNSLWFNGYTHYPFYPIRDEGDCYFIQIPYYHGQAFNKSMVNDFLQFVESQHTTDLSHLHSSLIGLDKDPDEWFSRYIDYLVQTNKFFVFPYNSLSSNFGDVGKHFKKQTNFFQVNMELKKRNFIFPNFNLSKAKYDHFFELLKLSEVVFKLPVELSAIEFDLNGLKLQNQFQKPYTFTIRRTRNPIMSFNLNMKPPELNIIFNISG